MKRTSEAPRPQAGASRQGNFISCCAPSPHLSRRWRDGVCGARSGQRWTLDLGARFRDGGTQFRVWAPRASSVSLVIAGESGNTSMEPEGNGYYTLSVKSAREQTRYFYLLNGTLKRPDPASRFQPEGVHGPSGVIDPEGFEWEDQDWRGIPLEGMVIYELHVGTFTPDGTFEGIIPHLEYLKNGLGVTAIELMPVGQFPGARNWGYDGTYLYAPQNSYGGPSGLKTLINASHKKGLAVILDVVYNHLGPEGNYLGDFGPYFTDRYKTPWGQAINFDGPESDEVRKFLICNALYWITEYHMDGLRIDAIHGIFDFSARHILAELKDSLRHQEKNLRRPIVLIGESDLNDVRVVNPPSKGGFGLDAQWNDDFHHCLHTLLTEDRSGYYGDFGEIDQLVKALREGFVYSGQYSPYRKRRHGSSSRNVPSSRFVIFSQNHDQVGNRMKGDRLSTLVPFEALKLAAGIVLLSPYTPLLFMGEEYGEKAPFQYFTSHLDPELVEAVRKGRKEEFEAFQWEDEVPDPQDETTFFRSKIDLNLHQQGNHQVLFEYYRRLLGLRREVPILSASTRKGMEVRRIEGTKTVLMARRCNGDQTISLFNFDTHPSKVHFQFGKGLWKKVVDSSSENWDGPGTLAPEMLQLSDNRVCDCQLNPYNFVLYRQEDESP